MPLHERLVQYLKKHYPTIITIGRFARWGLTMLQNTFFGIGGIALLVIIGLYVAGALIEPARWYLVGIASGLLVLCGGLLALSYARFMIGRFLNEQVARDFPVLLDRQLNELKKRARWRMLRDRYKGRRAFLIGNGPSLNKTPLHLLKDEFTMCFNRFDLMFERLGWRPTMYMCVDDRVAEDIASRINEIVPLVSYAFFPDIHPSGVDFRRFIEDARNIFWLSLKGGEQAEFHDDLPACGLGGTVTRAGLQVLAFMGFSPIFLVGVDMDYRDHATAVTYEKWHLTSTRNDDPNHFDPRYFGAGAKYHHPRLHDSYLPFLQRAKEHLDRTSVKVLNAGIDGSLEIFPRVDFRSLFNFKEDAELEMLLDAVPSELQKDSLQALRGDKIIEVQDDWDEKCPFTVTSAQLGERLIPKVIFTHISYGPFGNRYLFIRREKVSSAAAATAAR